MKRKAEVYYGFTLKQQGTGDWYACWKGQPVFEADTKKALKEFVRYSQDPGFSTPGWITKLQRTGRAS